MNESKSNGKSLTGTAVRVLKTIGMVSSTVILAAIDWYHQYTLRIHTGERAQAPTKRIRLPEKEKQRISARQNHLCMYCGVRLNRVNREIDHIYPVEFGGSNADSNYQALCGPCNRRKGLQIDEDFRSRYREALVGVSLGRPPSRRIPHSRFQEITQRTRQGETTRALRQSVFRTPKQKIMTGSTLAGGVLGGVWFFAVAVFFGDTNIGGQVALYGGLVVFGVVWVGSMWRAKYTGILDQ